MGKAFFAKHPDVRGVAEAPAADLSTVLAELGEKLESENPPLIFQQSKLILEISDAITANSRVGPLKVAAIISDQGKFILDKSDSGSHLVTLKSEADIGKILMEIENQ